MGGIVPGVMITVGQDDERFRVPIVLALEVEGL